MGKWPVILLTALLLAGCSSGAGEPAPPPQPSESQLPLDALLEQYQAQAVTTWEEGDLALIRYLKRDAAYETLAVAGWNGQPLLPLRDGLMPEAKVAVSEDPYLNAIYILYPGTDLISPHRLWPTVECIALPDTPLDAAAIWTEPYLMPLDRAFAIGSHQGALVERARMTEDQIDIFFQDGGGLFVGGDPLTPEMELSFQEGICTVRFPGSALSSDFDAQTLHGQGITLNSAYDTPSGAELSFSCPLLSGQGGTELRWYVQESAGPVTGLPRVTICLAPYEEEMYPQGW